MGILSFSPVRMLLFVTFSALFLLLSRKALRNPRCHGFYRFFVFEGILFLVLYNHPFWFIDVFSPWQLVSWALLSASILLVITGLYMLVKRGGSKARDGVPENLAFENTASLVTEGIYRYVRHPMYTSLLLLTWGAFFKHFSVIGLSVTIFTTFFMVIAGVMEERENLAFFGPAYQEYRQTTAMFLPFIL